MRDDTNCLPLWATLIIFVLLGCLFSSCDEAKAPRKISERNWLDRPYGTW